MERFSQLLLYIPGIIIFLVGSGQMRGWIRRLNPKSSVPASVTGCEHVVKKDKRDNEVYNFYNVTAEYMDPENGHKVRQAFKSPTEYAAGQQVRIYFGTAGEKPMITEKESEAVFHPLVVMIGGALLILLALFENQKHEIRAMACLSAVLAGGGLGLIWNYLKLKRKGLQAVTAEVVDIYRRQISKETKILRGSKFTYYPVVKYTADGKENLRRCNINSSGEKSFRVGDTMTLYRDPATGAVMERHAQAGALAAGIVLLVLGVLAGLSILSVVL